MSIDQERTEYIISGVTDAQRDAEIAPPILEVDHELELIRILDRRVLGLLSRTEEEKFREFIEDKTENWSPPRPKKRNLVSASSNFAERSETLKRCLLDGSIDWPSEYAEDDADSEIAPIYEEDFDSSNDDHDGARQPGTAIN
jgi:hypothetical protein